MSPVAMDANKAVEAINGPLPEDKKLPVTLLSGFLGERAIMSSARPHLSRH